MNPDLNIIDALALTCLIGGGACFVVVIVGIVGGLLTALFEGGGLLGRRPKRRKH